MSRTLAVESNGDAKALDNRIDMSGPVAEICRRLSLDPADVAEIRIEPAHCQATIYLHNDNGVKYVHQPSGLPVMGIINRKIRT